MRGTSYRQVRGGVIITTEREREGGREDIERERRQYLDCTLSLSHWAYKAYPFIYMGSMIKRWTVERERERGHIASLYWVTDGKRGEGRRWGMDVLCRN